MPRSPLGQLEVFAPPGRNGRFSFSYRTFVGTSDKGGVAPIPVTPLKASYLRAQLFATATAIMARFAPDWRHPDGLNIIKRARAPLWHESASEMRR